jgi:glycosyltransferase involved in cell wall biosynthesis
MRVAMLAPISWRVPPRAYGPWERFVALLTEGLVDAGVDVTLFATADSQTSARLVGTTPRGYSEDPSLDAKVEECLHIATAMERAAEFDLVHNSFDFLPLSYAALISSPMVTTIHGFSSRRVVPVYERYDDRTWYVAISDADRHPRLHYAATVHHGIEIGRFPWSVHPGDYLLFFGRVHPDKGTAEAIAVARAAGLPLLMAGIVQDQDYFERWVAPHIDGERVHWLGALPPDEGRRLLAGARALLHLIAFDEPFGLSVVEAMACGTPVIAHPRGSMPELVTDGETGFLVKDSAAAITAVDAVGHLNRRAIRAVAERRFDRAKMVERYLDVYRRILSGDLRPTDDRQDGGGPADVKQSSNSSSGNVTIPAPTSE